MKRRHIFVTDQQLRFLGELSKITGLSVSELVRRAVDEYLEKKEVWEK